MNDLERPCAKCTNGDHTCSDFLCGCLADHADDSNILRGFKILKRQIHPERETWVKGGWARP